LIILWYLESSKIRIQLILGNVYESRRLRTVLYFDSPIANQPYPSFSLIWPQCITPLGTPCYTPLGIWLLFWFARAILSGGPELGNLAITFSIPTILYAGFQIWLALRALPLPWIPILMSYPGSRKQPWNGSMAS